MARVRCAERVWRPMQVLSHPYLRVRVAILSDVVARGEACVREKRMRRLNVRRA